MSSKKQNNYTNLIIIFIIGLYVTVYFNNPYSSKKSMVNVSSKCPNMLVKKEMYYYYTIPINQLVIQTQYLF